MWWQSRWSTAITPVSFDHVQFLGTTLTSIAGEKAGILKARVPAVIGPQSPEALAAIEARAAAIGAPLFRFGREWRVEPSAGGLAYTGPNGTRKLPPPSLSGRHQIDNAGVALACLDRLGEGFRTSEMDMRRGLRAAEWPARLQRLVRGPLVGLLPRDSELWLDGGHNAAAGEALAEVARGWAGQPPRRPLHLVFGMLDTKEPRKFLAPLAPWTRSVQAVPIPGGHAGLSAEEVAADARAVGIEGAAAAGVEEAVAAIAAADPGPFRILICGSLYLAGSVLAENG